MIISLRYIILFLLFFPLTVLSQLEICDNGIDDDNDGYVDLNDEDCECQIIEPISLIPNPSFEDMNCCPDNRSQLNCASNWIQASEPTTDFIHLCGWLGWDDFPPPFPFPDGHGIMGFRDGRVRNNAQAEPYWKEYAGACLLSPLLTDSIYRFQFDVGFVNPQKSPPIEISFFGTNNCDFLPFGVGNNAFGCPANSPNWKKLNDVLVSGGSGNKWIHTSLEIIPEEDIYAIAIGPACSPVSSPISIYYFFDNLLLADFESFNLQIVETNHPCSNDFTLSVPHNSEFDYQWYKSGMALEGESSSELSQNYGEGEYQLRILDGSSCRISATFEYAIPEFEETQRVVICQGDYFNFGERQLAEEGTYLDTFKTADNCDRIVTLELVIIGSKYDTTEASILEGETFEIESFTFSSEGEHPVILTSSIGCDSLLLLKLTHFNIYIPNVFSPNQYDINNNFGPMSEVNKIKSIDMSIYDRWSNLLYKGAEWNGSNAQAGVYFYVMDIGFEFDKSKTFSGSVTLIK